MRAVQSSNIAAIGFDQYSGADIGTLTVNFRNGRTYAYQAVPATVYDSLLAETEKPDGSVGRAFASQVRSAGFEFEEVEQ